MWSYNFKLIFLFLNYSFPTNEVERKIWCALLGFGEERVLPKRAELCSEHFHKSDFYYKNTGAKYLRKGATPVQVNQKDLRYFFI